MSSRFAGLSRWRARLVLLATLTLAVLGLAGQGWSGTADATVAKVSEFGDAKLYRAVSARVAAGEDYYATVADEHRLHGYPLKPFVTVRPPLLARTSALVGGARAMEWALLATVLGALGAMLIRLSQIGDGATRLGALVLVALSIGVFLQPALAVWHEVWAGVLVTLALAIHRPARWWPAVLVALAAALVRELAIPFLLVMGTAAAVERRLNEALGWVAATIVVGLALALHAADVAAVLRPGDPGSPGWSGAGWSTVIAMMSQVSVLSVLPRVLVAVCVPLALLGWAGLRSPLGPRVALWTFGMATTFAAVARPDNVYWGVLIAPLLPVGLAFAPRAARDLVRAAR